MTPRPPDPEQRADETRQLRLLVVTPKLCVRVGDRCYSTGGTPKELNALATRLDLTLLAQILDASTVPAGWEALDASINCRTLGRVHEALAVTPPLLSARRTTAVVGRLVGERRPDLVLLKGPSEVSLFPLPLLRRAGIPSIYHYSLDWLGSVDSSRRLTRVRRLAAPYFAYVKWYRRRALRHFLPHATAVATVCTPVARSLEPYCRSVVLLRETFTTRAADVVVAEVATKTRGRFLYVGRLERNKNVAAMLHAARLLKERGVRDVSFVIVGNGEERESLRSLAALLGVANSVQFVGYVANDRLRAYYAAAWALVLPSFSEMLGQVIIEAFATGTPVVAANVGGVPDIVRDRLEGMLVDPFSPESLAGAVAELAAMPDDAYVAMQRAAVARAREHTCERALETWLSTFTSVVDQTRSPTARNA